MFFEVFVLTLLGALIIVTPLTILAVKPNFFEKIIGPISKNRNKQIELRDPTFEDLRKVFYHAGKAGAIVGGSSFYELVKTYLGIVYEAKGQQPSSSAFVDNTSFDLRQKDYDAIYQTIIDGLSIESIRGRYLMSLKVTKLLKSSSEIGLDSNVDIKKLNIEESSFDEEEISKLNDAYYSGFYDHTIKTIKKVVADLETTHKAKTISRPHENYNPIGSGSKWDREFREIEN